MIIKTMIIAIILAIVRYPTDARIHYFTTDMGGGVHVGDSLGLGV